MNNPASVRVSSSDLGADGRARPRAEAADGVARRNGRRNRFEALRALRRTFLGPGLVLAALVASCAVRNLPPPDPSHPASPEAAESTLAEPAAFLGQLGGVIDREEDPASDMEHGPGMMHGGGGMMQHGAGGAGHGH